MTKLEEAREAVAEMIHRKQAFTASDVPGRDELGGTNVYAAIREAVGDGLLEEAGTKSGGRGKPAQIFQPKKGRGRAKASVEASDEGSDLDQPELFGASADAVAPKPKRSKAKVAASSEEGETAEDESEVEAEAPARASRRKKATKPSRSRAAARAPVEEAYEESVEVEDEDGEEAVDHDDRWPVAAGGLDPRVARLSEILIEIDTIHAELERIEKLSARRANLVEERDSILDGIRSGTPAAASSASSSGFIAVGRRSVRSDASASFEEGRGSTSNGSIEADHLS